MCMRVCVFEVLHECLNDSQRKIGSRSSIQIEREEGVCFGSKCVYFSFVQTRRKSIFDYNYNKTIKLRNWI